MRTHPEKTRNWLSNKGLRGEKSVVLLSEFFEELLVFIQSENATVNNVLD